MGKKKRRRIRWRTDILTFIEEWPGEPDVMRGLVTSRFFRKVKVRESGCWEWSGRKDRKGYGIFSIKGYWFSGAHRVAYELAHGPIEYGDVVVRHLCDNPPCVSVDHLRLGSHADNMADRALPK